MADSTVGTPSTPSRKSGRRSWFTPGNMMQSSIKFDIENLKENTPPRKVNDTKNNVAVECMVLTHFTNPPRLDFGRIKLGSSKSCQLRIQNPHDCDQIVKIEKFPFKKNFIVDSTEFLVPGQDEVTINITWSPTEEGPARGMGLFLVDGVYRLQAIMFGMAEDTIKPKKKRGLAATKTSSILSMKNTKSFSSRKISPNKPGTKLKSRRSSGKIQKVKPAPAISPEVVDPLIENWNPDQQRIHALGPQGTPLTPRRSMRRSLTYTHMNEIGKEEDSVKCKEWSDGNEQQVTIEDTPMRAVSGSSNRLQTSSQCLVHDTPMQDVLVGGIQSHFDSNFPLDNPMRSYIECNQTVSDNLHIPAQQMMNTNPTEDEPVCTEVKHFDTPTNQMSHTCMQMIDTPAQGFLSPDSFLNDSLNHIATVAPKVELPAEHSVVIGTPMGSVASPESFMKCSHLKGLTVNKPFASSTLVATPSQLCSATVSPNSFLQDSLRKAESRTLHIEVDTPMRLTMNENVFDSRNASDHNGITQVPSPTAVFDKTVPHNLLLQQLKQKKEEITHNGQNKFDSPVRDTVIMFSPKQADALKPKAGNISQLDHVKKLFPEITDTPSPRRETVIVPKPKQVFSQNQVGNTLFEDMLHCESPRRETYLVPKQRQGPSLPNTVKVLHVEIEKPRCQQLFQENPATSTGKSPIANASLVETEDLLLPDSKPVNCLTVTKSEEESKAVNSNTVTKTKPFGGLPTTQKRRSSKKLFKDCVNEVYGNVHCKDIEKYASSPNKNQSANHDNEIFPDAEMGVAGISATAKGCTTLQNEPANTSTEKLNAKEFRVAKQKESNKGISQSLSGTSKLSEAFTVDLKKVSAPRRPYGTPPRNEKQLEINKGVPKSPLSSHNFPVQRSWVTSNLTKKRSHSETRSESETRKVNQSEKKVKGGNPKPSEPKSVEVKGLIDRSLTRTQKLRIAAAGGNVKTALAKEKQATKKQTARCLAQSRLVLTKKANTALPKHPMPFASKNMYYDERWIEKQDCGFTKWLNFVLTPPDFELCNSVSKPKKIDVGRVCTGTTKSEQKLAPTKEILSFRAYSARRNLNRLRRAACLLFQTEPIVRVIQKVEAEVECGRLAVRKDRKLRADLGIKQAILDMMLSYNPLWLRIGLETIYGELIPIHSNTDVIGLSRFILFRLLSNPDIATTYAHPTVPHLFKEGYDEKLAKFALKKFLCLVFFLDRAKLTRLIDHDPCLFCKDSDFKTNRDLLLEFSRNYLSGEGDVTKHLRYLGYVVTHKQTTLEEYDYAVTNLSLDLRDGMRLTRAIELLTQNWELTKNLRAPAISRLQKVHNVEVGFKALKERGIDVKTSKGGGVTAKDIVDGHREKTHVLLWQLIFNFQVEVMLNAQLLRDEICFLNTNMKIKNQLADVNSDVVPNDRNVQELNMYFKTEKLSLLLKWCKSVCAYYNMEIDNFTVSFSDGRAFCYILHHYHPGLLPLTAINKDTTQTMHSDEMEGSGSDDSFCGTWTMTYSPTTGKSTQYNALLANERENFKMLYEKVSELGGVPFMLKSSDMSGTIPDEKVVITYASYLCSRLLDIRHEIRAARIIQVAYRKHLLAKKQESLKDHIIAAKCIQKMVRDFLSRCRQQRAATKIQMAWRSFVAKKCLQSLRQKLFQRQERAACTIQSAFRAAVVRKQILRQNIASVKIQSWYKCNKAQQKYKKMRSAAIVLQQHFRMHQIANAQKQKYQLLRSATITVQKLYRANLAKKYVKRLRAAVCIQAAWKCNFQHKLYRQQRSRIIFLQALARRNTQQKLFQKMRISAMLIQSAYRAFCLKKTERQKYLKVRTAVKLIQSHFRKFACRRNFVNLKMAAITAQALWRSKITATKYREMKKSAIKIQNWYRSQCVARSDRENYLAVYHGMVQVQACFRGWLARRNYQQVKAATLVLQANVRKFISSTRFMKMKQAAKIIQNHYRSYKISQKVRAAYCLEKKSAIILQSAIKSWLSRRQFLKQKQAAVVLQSTFRCYSAFKLYQRTKQAAVVLQRSYRALIVGRQQWLKYNIQRGACITIQAYIRGHLVRQNIQCQNHAATVIQSAVKKYFARSNYLKLKNAVSTLQKYTRAYLIGSENRIKFLQMKKAACIIQAAYRKYCIQNIYCRENAATVLQANWRRHLARKSFVKHKNAALRIQSFVKMWQARKRFVSLKKATILLQSRFRALKVGRKQLLKYRITYGAIVTMQACIRGFLVRCEVQKMHQAATVIQTQFRKMCASNHYKNFKDATVTLQRAYRNRLLTHKIRSDFLKKRISAILIQRIFRGFIQKRNFNSKRSAALNIQRKFRGYIVRKEHSNKTNAAVVIQKHFRANQLRNEAVRCYQAMRKAVVLLQSIWRGALARKQAKAERAARYIQSTYKMYIARKEFHMTQHACITLQSHVRCYIVKKQYNKILSAVCQLQSKWRQTVMQRKIRQYFLHVKQAAVIIQAYIRGYQIRMWYNKQKKAAVLIQSHFRCILARKHYKQVGKAVVSIQNRWRETLLQRQMRYEFMLMKGAAITIQAYVRCFQTRLFYMKKRQAAILIQSLVRRHQIQIKYQEKQKAIVAIQNKWRGILLSRHIRRNYVNMKYAAITIQAYFRGYRLRSCYMETRKAVICLQSNFKCFFVRRQYCRIQSAVNAIQEKWRATLLQRQVKLKYEIMLGAIITVQAWARGYIARCHYRVSQGSVIKIQTAVRGHIHRKRYQLMKNAAVKIQRFYRNALKQRAEYVKKVGAAITIQAWVRGNKARKFLEMMKAARTIQSCYRGYREKIRYQETCAAIVRLQAHFKGFVIRKHYAQLLRQWKAASVIQHKFRSFLKQKEEKKRKQRRLAYLEKFAAVAQTNLAVVRIQRCFKNFKAIKLAKQQLHSVITIQRWMRVKLQRIQFLKVQCSVRLLQNRLRKCLKSRREAAIKIQSSARVWLARRYVEAWKKSIVTLQAHWKGHLERKLINNKKLIQVRQRVVAATKAATEDKKLCNRTTSALDYLLQYRQLSFILEALINLDVATRLSSRCCDRMVEGHAVNVIFTLIRSCNRSLPHMEIIKYSVNVLLNLAKYEATVQAVYEADDSVETLLDLMQIYREKGLEIFCKTSMLFGLLCQDNDRKQVILQLPRVAERVRSFHCLIVRKVKMEEKRKVVKAKIYLSKITVPAKQVKVRPDWILHSDKVTNFECPLVAINYIMSYLHLTPK